jgi:RNA polymerase subunit RPABC4/transcription elongation factor Spt4
MQPKFCARCQFVIPDKSKLCPICGSRKLALAQTAVIEQAAESESSNIVDKVRSVMHDFADDVALTMEKSGRAWSKMKRLIRGAE